MSKNTLTNILKLAPDEEMGNVSAAYLKYLKTLIHDIVDNPSDQKCESTIAHINECHQQFYDFVIKSVDDERENYKVVKDHPDAQRSKKRAREVRALLEKKIIEFTQCYVRLNQSTGRVHSELAKVRAAQGEGKKIEWTRDTARIMKQYRKEYVQLQEELERLTRGVNALQKCETKTKEFAAAVEKLVGKKDLKDAMRPLRGALRAGNFMRAGKALEELSSKKGRFSLGNASQAQKAVKDLGQVYIKVLGDHQGDLKGVDGRLLLDVKELNVIVASNLKSLEQKKAFIQKYHRPFLEHKLKSIHLLKEKLGVVGSIDSLLGLYTRMMRGMTLPMTDIKEIREYEAEVIENVDYLLDTKFKEVEKINQWNGDEMNDFAESLEGFKLSNDTDNQETKKVSA